MTIYNNETNSKSELSKDNLTRFFIVIGDTKNTVIVLLSFKTEPRCISA